MRPWEKYTPWWVFRHVLFPVFVAGWFVAGWHSILHGHLPLGYRAPWHDWVCR